ncbi:hypothetical protein F5Y18DRAFT_396345 [Xylariaceae sp. FL1019]|nr:hypothetical protein F5Y18DRAFT_396345 [Xylariaceae sp. FL1019]
MDPEAGGVTTPDTNAGSAPGDEAPKKRIRKSRSRGLRTKTGCLTCRKRHKKCDEKSPICGPCSISSRECIYADGPKTNSIPHAKPESSNLSTIQEQGTGEPVLVLPSRPSSNITPSPHSLIGSVDDGLSQASSGQAQYPLEGPYQYSHSPETVASSTELLTADLASTRWLDLLATDAADADGGFSLGPSPTRTASNDSPTGVGEHDRLQVPPPKSVPSVPAPERYSWQLDHDLSLTGHEAVLFRIFAERAALWLDVFDPSRHFSTYATRLALRNVGFMKAILALAARHNAMVHASLGHLGGDTSDAIQYYYETLHYVQTALKYQSYAHSEELLGTAIVISTYEMLDSSDSNWQRHLKGVFWIQRSQNVNGASGGLRQAVWWAWLRQDYWAAFRERRRCFSFWRPVKDYPELSQDDLADRSIYLLSQVVNYCAHPDASSASDPNLVARRADAGEILMDMLERWKSFLGDKFTPLPAAPRGSTVFEPLWIHPPQYGVAIQVYHFARILVTLHRPAIAGLERYMKSQRVLSEAVASICGIAMELKDEGCQILSAQCLFGAGLCAQDEVERCTIISLIDACEARTSWPMAPLRADLQAEWARNRGRDSYTAM